MREKLSGIWELFRECVLRPLVGKVATVVGLIGTVQTIATLLEPDYVITVPHIVSLDNRFWFGLTILCLLLIIALLLRGANEYRQQLRLGNNLRIVYSPIYNACKQVEDGIETYRVGLRTVGKQVVDEPVVELYRFARLGEPKSEIKLPFLEIPLAPMRGDAHKVLAGFVLGCYVNVFTHKVRSPLIEFCYDHYKGSPTALYAGKYRLVLVARGLPNEIVSAAWVVTVDKKYNISIESERARK